MFGRDYETEALKAASEVPSCVRNADNLIRVHSFPLRRRRDGILHYIVAGVEVAQEMEK